MKPRLFKHKGLWYCLTGAGCFGGLGFTPADAYREWMARNKARP
jgi:hypothetical protein